MVAVAGAYDFPGASKKTLARGRHKCYLGQHRVAPSLPGSKPGWFLIHQYERADPFSLQYQFLQ
jgi:hypothetical protein